MIKIKNIKWLFNTDEKVSLKMLDSNNDEYQSIIDFRFSNLQLTDEYDDFILDRNNIWHLKDSTIIFVEKPKHRISLKQELLKAKINNKAILGLNFDNLDMLKGIVESAEETNSLIILMVSESTAKNMGIDFAIETSLIAKKNCKVPIILHYDHGKNLDWIKQAIDAGFDSVMIDASDKSYEKNVKLTKEIVDYAHSHKVEVEAEIGHVAGKLNDSTNQYTDIEEAKEFVKLTKIDALAVSVGTIHGLYKGKVGLQYDLIKKIADEIETPLVLHGSSDVPLEDLKRAIQCGITKINIGTDLKIAYTNGIKEYMSNYPQEYDSRKYNLAGKDEVKKIVKELLHQRKEN